MNLFNPEPQGEALAQQALYFAKHVQNTKRREDMQKRIDFYHGVQVDYLIKELKKQFTNFNRMKLQYEFFNITEMIIDELSTLYSEEPIRKLNNATELDKKIYDEIVETSGLNLTLKALNQYTKLCKTCLICPVYRYDKIEYDILTPNIFDVMQDPLNPTKAKAVIYSQSIDDSNPLNAPFYGNTGGTKGVDPMQLIGQVYFYWDEKSQICFSYDYKNGQYIAKINEQKGNKDNVNPYGQLPYVVVRDKFPVDKFFIEGGDDLINANILLNIKLTELNYLTKMQAFSQAVAKGMGKDTLLITDPSSVITIPADDDVNTGNDFKFVTPDGKIMEMLSDIESRLRRIAIKHKLPASMFAITGNKSSGYSLEMQNAQLEKAVTGDKPLYRQYEKELFEKTKMVWNYNNPGRKFSENVSLNIDYAELETKQAQDVIDAHNIIMYQNGLLSKERWIMQENGDIETIEEAKAYLKQIAAERITNGADQESGTNQSTDQTA